MTSTSYLTHKMWFCLLYFRAKANHVDFKYVFIEIEESRHLCIHFSFFSPSILVSLEFIWPRIFLIMCAVMKFSFMETAFWQNCSRCTND